MASLDPKAAPAALDRTTSSDRQDATSRAHSEATPSISREHLPYNKHDAGFVYRQTWKGKIWDTLDLPPFERRMLLKVDTVLLTLMALGYFLKNLDQHNVTAAFFSGMRHDLGMYGNELVTATTCWTVGYVIGQIPINLLLTRVSPRWVIPTLILIWGIATLGNYAIQTVTQLYVCRFLVGLFESGFYSAAHMILGSWYTPRELGKRAVIFWVSGFVGQMFAGYLQSAAYTNLQGVNGLEGWRWMFIIAIITIPIAIGGYFFYPDMPLSGKCPWWLKQEEFELACARAGNHGRVGREPWSRAKLKRLASSWHFWMLPMLYVLWNNGNIQSPFQYWMESFNVEPYPVPDRRFSVPQINNLPTVGTAFQIVSALAGAWISDGPLKGRRWPIILFDAGVSIVFAIAHLSTSLYSSVNGRIAFYWLMDIAVISGPLILSWSNEICADDLEKRALIVAMGNDFAFFFRAIVPNFVWQTVNFPEARIGLIYSISLNTVLVFWTFACMYMRRRELRIEAARKDALPRTETEGAETVIGDVESKDKGGEETPPVDASQSRDGFEPVELTGKPRT